MDFNICIVRPQGYIHSDAFLELAQVIAYGLEDLGYKVAIRNHIIESNKNIIIGCHLLDPVSIESVPKDSIVINTEQIFSNPATWSVKWTETILQWAKRFETWDYSVRNIEMFNEHGVRNVKLLKIGYHPKLARIEKAVDQDIDVLFYGSMNDRRKKIINDLKREGHVVRVISGIYGEARDQIIARSRIVLNMHYYSTQIFEVIRVFYPMINSKAVVSEVNPATSIDEVFLTGISAAPYEGIISACGRLLADKNLQYDLERKAFHAMVAMPQKEIMGSMINDRVET